MEAPRKHLFPFIEREGGESSLSTDQTEAREERKQADAEEEPALEETAKLEEAIPTSNGSAINVNQEEKPQHSGKSR